MGKLLLIENVVAMCDGVSVMYVCKAMRGKTRKEKRKERKKRNDYILGVLG